jgi:hypothetical protein
MTQSTTSISPELNTLPDRAPESPQLRRIYVQELKRRYQAGCLDLAVNEADITDRLLEAIFSANPQPVHNHLQRVS